MSEALMRLRPIPMEKVARRIRRNYTNSEPVIEVYEHVEIYALQWKYTLRRDQ